MYYTYAWRRDDGTPYYIGKGKGDRAWRTHWRWRNGKQVKWGVPKNVIILKEFVSELDAYKHERYIISILGLKVNGGLLANMSVGGEGGSRPGHCKGHSNHTPEQLVKASENALKRNSNQKGENNRNAKTYDITFASGKKIRVKSITTWAKNNGYSKAGLRNIRLRLWKYYKDIVAVVEVSQPPL